ncbi:MAG: hypothetical protein A2381_11125 [Bdellovibrionales bacterium RIFOXYB1_FULL_37_110]|nr:MAG: hypothetical protein A2181_01445 [Bdellovibrionales bacterium RIFOXYA1_FULL_38_20]OFZ48592.1 MAG: hypothetical protein A2417_09610 [Bdellovibrionales bacterium RIFOXYC1_FULL_37_79]OFZ58401.1 MAG: hypothetical protein A2381_11125 [Bdellovibrionales bacterium RIFOXYB1_FULL_37_110]OFZ62510.1 MAG: hypothetical protein A2577_01205 [Bdellovibrionales bacterium RIFOXYD1_FULL_36_51]
MKKLTTIIFVTLLSTGAYAGCLQTVTRAIIDINSSQNKNISLLTEKSRILEPGEEGQAYFGEFYNNTKSNVEVFFLTESNGYYQNYFALLLDAQSCTIVTQQSLGDNA